MVDPTAHEVLQAHMTIQRHRPTTTTFDNASRRERERLARAEQAERDEARRLEAAQEHTRRLEARRHAEVEARRLDARNRAFDRAFDRGLTAHDLEAHGFDVQAQIDAGRYEVQDGQLVDVYD